MRDRLLRLLAMCDVPVAPFDSWLCAAVAAGPTPLQGPLTHDLWLGDGLFGLTLFDGGDGRPGMEARAWATQHGQSSSLDDFVAEEPAAALHAGLRWDGAEVLKLYRVGRDVVGLDLRESGPHRRRLYEVSDRPDLADLPGHDRTIEVRLAAADAVDGRAKATTAIIFRPGTPASAVPVAARRLRPGVRIPPVHSGLRAAALELDRWDDGAEAFDALWTIGEG